MKHAPNQKIPASASAKKSIHNKLIYQSMRKNCQQTVIISLDRVSSLDTHFMRALRITTHALIIEAISHYALQQGSLSYANTIPHYANFRYVFFSGPSLTEEFSGQYDLSPSGCMRGFCLIVNTNMSAHKKFSD